MAWIDYQKAFDRVPYSWIIKSQELIGINNKVISFTKKVMNYWKTHTCLHTENKLIETEGIKIQCGIFQGDSLSPLLFCICLIPLTEQLNRLNTVYEECTTKTKISQILVLFFRESYYDLNEKTSVMQSNKYIFHLSSFSTCFGQYIAHHQEINKMYKISIWCQTCNKK